MCVFHNITRISTLPEVSGQATVGPRSNRFKTSIIKKWLCIILCLVSVFSALVVPQAVYAQNISTQDGQEKNLLLDTATYVIAASDAPAAEKAQAGVVCDGTEDQVEINAAITAGYKHIVLSSGTFTTSARIKFESDLWFQGQGSGTIIKIGGDYNGIYVSNKTRVTLSDLEVDGDNKNTGIGSHAVLFFDSTQFTARNLSIVNSHSFSLMAQNSSYGLIDDIYCSSDLGHGHDGVHLHESSNIIASNISGSTGDDLFAIGSKTAASCNITATNIEGTSPRANLCRIYITEDASAGADVSNIVVSNISGTGKRLLIINSDVNGTISGVSVNNITGIGTTNGILVDPTAGGTISDIYIDGFALGGGLPLEEQFATPIDISLSNSTVNKNEPEGTIVGTFNTVDPDTGSTFTYTLVSGDGSTNNASFSITGNTLKTAASFDYEAKNSYSIRVRSTDNSGLWYEERFTISVIENIDINQDGFVNILDMILIGQHWGETGVGGWILEDVNKDGVINVSDSILLGQNWT